MLFVHATVLPRELLSKNCSSGSGGDGGSGGGSSSSSSPLALIVAKKSALRPRVHAEQPHPNQSQVGPRKILYRKDGQSLEFDVCALGCRRCC